MFFLDPYELRRPLEHILGTKGARLARLFEIIRHQNLAETIEQTLAAKQAPQKRSQSGTTTDFLHAAQASLGAA